MEKDYGLTGRNPAERLRQLSNLSVEGIAILLEDINKSVQGSRDSLMNHETTMKVGGRETLAPEDRYDVFLHLVDRLKSLDKDVSPQRAMDALALAVVMLHPFHDGNGRTARVLGMIGRDDYDSDEFINSDYDTITEPRDEARKRGGYVIYGYVPHLPEGADQSSAKDVIDYLDDLLDNDREKQYTSCYGQAPLHAE